MAPARIEVDHVGGDTFRVKVGDGGGSTTHMVRVEPVYSWQLVGSAVRREDLVRDLSSFCRTRAEGAILRSFDLSVIARYFPEYEAEIARRIGAG